MTPERFKEIKRRGGRYTHKVLQGLIPELIAEIERLRAGLEGLKRTTMPSPSITAPQWNEATEHNARIDAILEGRS